MIKIIQKFPLPTIQSGAMLGNGKTGVLLWGSNNTLNITIGCADLWDHRGGLKWTAKQNYREIRTALENQDKNKLAELFSTPKTSCPVRRPSLIPVGRVVLTLPETAVLLRYEQDLSSGITEVYYQLDGKENKMNFCASMDMSGVVTMTGVSSCRMKLIDSYTLTGIRTNSLAKCGFEAPEHITRPGVTAFIQPMPADDEFVLACYTAQDECMVKFSRNRADLQHNPLWSFAESSEISRKFWQNFWQDIPVIEHYDQEISKLYWHGLYKYGIMTNPAGVTPGLQGPWIEDDHLPPWSGDYHFNINVQMCNLPGYRSGKKENLKKLFDMVLSWKDDLRQNAFHFAGITDGFMLPHAVDDRCVCMGDFWSGTIDHGCSAWIAGMMFDYCDTFGDMEFLRDEVFDFMRGVMKIFEFMLERDADGTFYLPLTVSPEYRASQIDAWGKNSSFQLAALHRLNRNLIKASKLLDREPEAIWLEIEQKLPEFSICDGEIAIWEGLLLEESHRHHSHLAAICPFDVIDPQDKRFTEIVNKSLDRWHTLGMGLWSGWCLSWASQIYTRVGNAEMANLILKIWTEVFTNCGGGSLHYARFRGFGMYSELEYEVMQMDAVMGAVTAIQDQFIHSQNGILRIFYGIPVDQPCSFKKMFAPGGFIVSGTRTAQGETVLTVVSSRANELSIQLPGTEVFRQTMAAGETLHLISDGAKWEISH